MILADGVNGCLLVQKIIACCDAQEKARLAAIVLEVLDGTELKGAGYLFC